MTFKMYALCFRIKQSNELFFVSLYNAIYIWNKTNWFFSILIQRSYWVYRAIMGINSNHSFLLWFFINKQIRLCEAAVNLVSGWGQSVPNVLWSWKWTSQKAKTFGGNTFKVIWQSLKIHNILHTLLWSWL